jgi:hypothetical protein
MSTSVRIRVSPRVSPTCNTLTLFGCPVTLPMRHAWDTGNPPYSNLAYLQGDTGIRSVWGARVLG